MFKNWELTNYPNVGLKNSKIAYDYSYSSKDTFEKQIHLSNGSKLLDKHFLAEG